MKRTLLLLGALVAWPNVSSAKDIVVAPNGDDAAQGDASAPFRTIQHGVDVATAGDTVTVHAGTYAEGVHFTQSGAPGQPIVLRAFPDERPVIEPAIADFPLLIEAEPWQDGLEIGWITVQGFELRNATVAAVVELTNTHDVVIANNYIHDGVGQGILGGGHDIVIDGNEIARCGDVTTNLDHGMYLTGRRITIINNLVHDNSSFGIQVAAYNCGGICPGIEYSGTVDWLIANNVIAFEKNRSGIVVWEPDASYGDKGLGEMSDIRIVNNVFLDNNHDNPGGTNGVDFWSVTGDVSTIAIQNNVFWSSYGGPGLGTSATNAGVGADMAVLGGNLDADPMFVDATNLDFHLSASSPAIDSGIDVPECTYDFDGKSRPLGAHWDVGAFEYGSDAPGGAGGAGSGSGPGSGAGPSSAATSGEGTSTAGPGGEGERDNPTDGGGGCGCAVRAASSPSGACSLLALAVALSLRRTLRRRTARIRCGGSPGSPAGGGASA